MKWTNPLKTTNCQNLLEKKTSVLNSPISIKEIKFVIKISPHFPPKIIKEKKIQD